VTDIQKTTKK